METLGTVRQIPPPAGVRAISTLARIDYEDAFRVETSQASERAADDWARAILDDAPERTRDKLSRGWAALGLRLGSRQPGPDRVLGWPIRRRTPDLTLVGTTGRLGMSGELLFLRQPDALLFATFVQFDNPIARQVWVGLQARHQQIVHDLLTAGFSRAGAGPASGSARR